MRMAMLYARIRPEERLLVESMHARNIDHELIDVRTLVLDPESAQEFDRFDVVFDRCLSLTQALTALEVLHHQGVRCINEPEVVRICADKLRTSAVLAKNGVAQPRCRVATDAESALRAVDELGYPCVLKPTVGSWGRLLARINDRDAAEALIEHKLTLGGVQQQVLYFQEYVRKPDADLRIFVVGGSVIAGIERRSAHWVTNTARGAEATGATISEEIRAVLAGDLAATVAEAGTVILTTTDLSFVDPDDGPADVTYTVSNQVNGSVQLIGLAATTLTGQDVIDGL
ncbi:MAG: RimK family alpha-L-glutamate ligase [Planctomycetota bacterium]